MKQNNYVVFIILSLLYCYPLYSVKTFKETQQRIAQELAQKKKHKTPEPSSAETSKPLTHYLKLKKVPARKRPTSTPFVPKTPAAPIETEEIPPAPAPYLETSRSNTPPPPAEPLPPCPTEEESLPAYPEEAEDIPAPSLTDEDVANEELLEAAALGQKGIDIAKMRTALEHGADAEIEYPQHDSRFKGDYAQLPTPLFTVIGHYNDPIAAELLLMYGADTSVRNSHGKYIRNLINDDMPHGQLFLQLIDNTREWGGKLPDEVNDLVIDNIAPVLKTIADVQKFADQEAELAQLVYFNDLAALRRFYSEKNAGAREKILNELKAIPAAPTDEK